MPLYPGFCPKKEYFKYILFPVKIKERLQPAGITLSYQQSLPFPACGVLLYVLLTPAYADMNSHVMQLSVTETCLLHNCSVRHAVRHSGDGQLVAFGGCQNHTLGQFAAQLDRL